MSVRRVSGSGVLREIEIALQVLDSVIPDGDGSYLAAPISTGRRYFDALAKHRAKDLAGLILAIGEDEYLRTVRWPNVEDGEALAAHLRRSGVQYLINTGPILADGWGGRDYMNLCFRLIEQKVKAVYFHPEWAYSSGAVKEYIFCHERGLSVFTAERRPLSVAAAREALQSARAHLERLGLPCQDLDSRIARIDEQFATATRQSG